MNETRVARLARECARLDAEELAELKRRIERTRMPSPDRGVGVQAPGFLDPRPLDDLKVQVAVEEALGWHDPEHMPTATGVVRPVGEEE